MVPDGPGMDFFFFLFLLEPDIWLDWVVHHHIGVGYMVRVITHACVSEGRKMPLHTAIRRYLGTRNPEPIREIWMVAFAFAGSHISGSLIDTRAAGLT